MKVLIFATVCLIACVAARSVEQQQDEQDDRRTSSSTTTWIPILEYNKEQGQDGSYKTSYKTGNNIESEESGYIKDKSEEKPGGTLVQNGQYSYEAPDGTLINVQYTADETGFHATGDHIPTAAPVPAEIQAGLDQIYKGIAINKEKSEARAKSDPEYAKSLQARAEADYLGLYYPS